MIKTTFFEIHIGKNDVIGWKGGNVIYKQKKTTATLRTYFQLYPRDNRDSLVIQNSFIMQIKIINTTKNYNLYEYFLFVKNTPIPYFNS